MLELELGHSVDVYDTCDMSSKQTEAITKFCNGDNILLISAAGCGKSLTVQKMKEITKKRMYLTATTGVAAYSIGGMTIQAFLGIGTGDSDVDVLIRKVLRNEDIRDRLRATDVLVIDEASMLSAELFEKINQVLCAVRMSPLFFGGIQVIMSADFLQATPVFNKFKTDKRLLIESPLFLKKFSKSCIVLTENFRQRGNPEFIDLLMRLREGLHTEKDIGVLTKRLGISPSGPEPVHLVPMNALASDINKRRMGSINRQPVEYVMRCSGNADLKHDLSSQFKAKGADILHLKETARVMLTRNIDTENGLVNGACGTITSFVNGLPFVHFDHGIDHLVDYFEFKLEVDGKNGIVKQIPLQVAYASTIHKSQSLSLDSAILDLKGCFCEHQVYVALSRVKTLDGVFLKSFDQKKITINKKMLAFVNSV